MIQSMGRTIYKLTPQRFLKWRTREDKYEKHIIYCEKLAVVLIILFLYTLITILFTYVNWLYCTNILDLDNWKSDKIFYRQSAFCNSMDVIIVIYIVFLLIILLMNIVIGIAYYHYRQFKLKKFNKTEESNTSNESNNKEKIIVHVPMYNEDLFCMKATLDSIVNMNYEIDNILLLIVVDGIITQTDNKTTDYVLLYDLLKNDEYTADWEDESIFEDCIQYKDNYIKIYNDIYRGCNYSVVLKCGSEVERNNSKKAGNRGKKDSALIIYETINYMFSGEEYSSYCCYEQIVDKIQIGIDSKFQSFYEYEYMLIVDCDTEVQRNGLKLLMNYMKDNLNCSAVCGQTVVKNYSTNLVTLAQSFEYFISHLLLKTFESVLYKTMVLSGCFTLFKLRDDSGVLVNNNIITQYTKEADSLYQKNLSDLGEDRYLTVLIMKEHVDKDLKYISEALCFTNAPASLKVLVDQRRRWCNSLIVCLFLLFLKAPVQSVYRNTKMYIILITEMFIVFLLPIVIFIGLVNFIISITVQGFSMLPVVITTSILNMNLIIVLLTGRLDIAIRFIPFLLYLPFFSIYMPLYSIYKLDDLRWGLTRDSMVDDLDNSDNNSFQSIQTPKEEIAVMQLS